MIVDKYVDLTFASLSESGSYWAQKPQARGKPGGGERLGGNEEPEHISRAEITELGNSFSERVFENTISPQRGVSKESEKREPDEGTVQARSPTRRPEAFKVK